MPLGLVICFQIYYYRPIPLEEDAVSVLKEQRRKVKPSPVPPIARRIDDGECVDGTT